MRIEYAWCSAVWLCWSVEHYAYVKLRRCNASNHCLLVDFGFWEVYVVICWG